MPVLIPVTPDGARRVTVDTGSGVYRFRTYLSAGAENRWLLDILDIEEKPVLTGITIAPGSGNLLKGQGDAFEEVQLLAVMDGGTEGGLDALGNTLHLVWFGPGEENYFPALDPMDTIPSRLS